MQRFRLLVLFLGSFLALMSLFPRSGSTANHLSNGGFNNPFTNIPDRIWREQYEKIAAGWNHFYIEANTYPGSGNASKLHWMSSAQFAAAFSGGDYHIEGDASQNMWSAYEFDAGVYQQVSGLAVGQGYRFFIKMVTYWRGPGYPDTDGKMVKQVGIDPYGGTDPTGNNVIWSAPDANDNEWVGMVVAATAESNTITVFAKVQAPENDSFNHTDLDMVYFEDSRLEELAPGPTTSLNVAANGNTVNLNWSGSPAGGWVLKGYEVEYKDQAGGDWLTIQDKAGAATGGSFIGQVLHTYTVRARTWQTNGSIDMPGQWVEKSITIADAVTGQVIDHAGLGLSGVRVSVSGQTTSTLSNGGSYALPTGPGTFHIVADDFDSLVAPPPTTVNVPPNGVGSLTITLIPTGTHQAISNNHFETDLSGWNVSDGLAAGVSSVNQHTGSGSLWLSNTVNISQTGVVSQMNAPLLSFWHKNNVPFTVEFLAEGAGASSLDPSAARPILVQTVGAAGDWSHFTLRWAADSDYSGSLGVNFSHNGGPANIFIDEVSIAAAGFEPVYLPVVVKN
ncbi:MAG: fibronectin type III domain-containing protein [Anaerolineae bacterium]|nr:fibronectin type III domain-containing protein [Anaerolineae bacterium]